MFKHKQSVHDEKRLNKIIKEMQDKTKVDCSKIKFKRQNGFQIFKGPGSNIKIGYNKNLKAYKDFEVSYVLGHEIAHYEYNTTKAGYFLNETSKVKNIINELFSDIRGRQLSDISSKEIKEYFINSNLRYKATDELKQCWIWGYFTSKERTEFVNKYYDDYINNKLDVNTFGDEVINKYNEMCKELNKDKRCIDDNILIIDWIKNKYKENMKI